MKKLFIYIFVLLSSIVSSQEMIIDWDECFGDMGYTTYARAIEMLPNGVIVLTLPVNTNNSAFSNYHGETDAWVILLDIHGNLINERCFGGGQMKYSLI